jgi:carbon storage regulator
MLVLSRKIGEVITVGNSVKITVLSYDRGVVRLGIEAPKSISIHRKEVFDKIISINKKASRTEIGVFKDKIINSDINLIENNNKKDIAPSIIFSNKREI